MSADTATQDVPPAAPPSFPCPSCGHLIEEAQPDGDWVCPGCADIHYGAVPAFVPPVATPQPPAQPPLGTGTFADIPAPRTLPVGKVRPFWLIVVLSVVTFGLYGLAYWWMAFREVDEHAGRRHAWWLYVAGVLSFGGLVVELAVVDQRGLTGGRALVLMAWTIALVAAPLAYLTTEVLDVRAWRRSLGLNPGPNLPLLGAMVLADAAFSYAGWRLAAALAGLALTALVAVNVNEGWRAVAKGRLAA